MNLSGASVGKWTWFTPVMHALDPLRRKGMRKTLALLDQRIPLRAGTKVLDVAAGTGTLLDALVPYGCDVSAIEPTGTMFRHVRKRFPQVRVHQEPAHAMRSISDKSQDVTIVSATLHGFSPAYRQEVYRELKRVTRGAVAVIDYHWNVHPLVALIELAEGGDYFNFMSVAERELYEAFGNVKVTPCSDVDSLYLCRVR
jgi:SAM-dependent methyltransferase